MRGDFVSRRLPSEFVNAWDLWLQHAINTSREQLGEQWLDIYLTSPIWRFVLNAGLCGRNRWAGMMMPSVDSVGRYFPLTVAVQIPQSGELAVVMGTATEWFERVGELALSALQCDLDVEEFDDALQQMYLSDEHNQDEEIDRLSSAGITPGHGKASFFVPVKKSEDIFLGLTRLGSKIMQGFMPSFSLWSTAASVQAEGALIGCEGLPPIETFVALMRGDWGQSGAKTPPSSIPDLGTVPSSVLVPEVVAPLDQLEETDSEPVEQEIGLEPIADGESLRWFSTACTDVGTHKETLIKMHLSQMIRPGFGWLPMEWEVIRLGNARVK